MYNEIADQISKKILLIFKSSKIMNMLLWFYTSLVKSWKDSRMAYCILKETKINNVIKNSMWYKIVSCIYFLPNKLKIKHELNQHFVNVVTNISLLNAYAIIFLSPLLPTVIVAMLCLLSFFLLLIRNSVDRNFILKFGVIEMLIISLLAVFALSSVLSFVPSNSTQVLCLYAILMSFYFTLRNNIQNKKQFTTALILFVLSGFIVSLYGIFQYKFHFISIKGAWLDENMFKDIKFRIYSTFENPNVLGEYLILVMLTCLGLCYEKKLIRSLLFSFIFLTCGLALILTYSRGCWLSILLVMAIYITIINGKLWGLLIFAMPVVLYILPSSIVNRFTSIGNLMDTSSSYRLNIWFGTIEMLKDFWISGVGIGESAFNAVYPFYAYSATTALHSHGLFLQILVENGIIGLIIFLFIVTNFFKRVILFCKGKSKEIIVVPVVISLGVLGFLIQGMFDNCFYNYRVFLIFWIILSLGVCCTED